MIPWIQDTDVTLYHGDALDVLRGMPDASVHMCATSPPFWNLRDYNAPGQIGLEETPEAWANNLVAVFREVRRVLRDDGTLWLECGDMYAAYKPKDLVGAPWLLAFALRADGWYLRSEIIWARPNPMPESVTDRPTKAHSTVFLLSKRPSYYFDQDAIREAYAGPPEVRQGRVGAYQNRAMNGEGDGTTPTRVLSTAPPQTETLDGSSGEAPRGPDGRRQTAVVGGENSEQHRDGERWPNFSGANARSVWTIPTEPTPFAHFATWPQKLVARMILAGTSEKGCCPECGAPWVRDVERTPMEVVASPKRAAWQDSGDDFSRTQIGGTVKSPSSTRTLGWSPSCAHDYQPIPCTILDPFAGSGTTCLVARNHGRKSIGIELSADYCAIAADRLKQLSLLTELT